MIRRLYTLGSGGALTIRAARVFVPAMTLTVTMGGAHGMGGGAIRRVEARFGTVCQAGDDVGLRTYDLRHNFAIWITAQFRSGWRADFSVRTQPNPLKRRTRIE